MKIIALLGSLRKNSYNRQLLNEIIELTKDEIEFEIIMPDSIPLFNEDIEFPAPDSVKDLRDKIKRADGVWIFSPEYNHSLPGGLKNIFDWLSRPVEKNSGQVMRDVKVAISGVTPGISGTLNMQDDLMAFLCFVKADLMTSTRIYFNDIDRWEDENGNIDFTNFRDRIDKMIDEFIEFVKK
ncbi:MAG: NADPH-dependent FMN reductase [Andreesenia angusta]|nr:NADPH-dependent FMN reductase [Andreesenia angusta]